MSTLQVSPVHVRGELDPRLSRWLWLVKWLLAIPHYIVLAFLWIAFVVLSIVAFFAILLTGRYPEAIFDFNVGVLRWTWRVSFYTYGVLGTDRYPPFTLADVPDYPATFEVERPAELSRGLVLVKWWLLALPHYAIVGALVGGAWFAARTDGTPWWGGGVLGLLVLFAAVALLFTGRYPRGIFDFVLGIHRWALRVGAYAALMTDVYPPFRLDQGPEDPPGTLAVAGRSPSAEPAGDPSTSATDAGSWSAGRVVLAVGGTLVALLAIAALAAGVAGIVVDRTQRDAAGYVMTPTHRFSTTTYALSSQRIDLARTPNWVVHDVLGTVRIRSRSARPVFVGIASARDTAAYLSGVQHAVVTDIGHRHDSKRVVSGGAPPGPPGTQRIWAASTSGAGTRTLSWHVRNGNWRIVAMNADASGGVTTNLGIGAKLNHLGWFGAGLLAVGVLLALAAAALIWLAMPRRRAQAPAAA